MKSSKARHSKSRNGCLRCKAKKTKCDEGKPGCARCEERGIQCPGYALNVRWSRKHQLRTDREATDDVAASPRQQNSVESETVSTEVDTSSQPGHGNEDNTPQFDPWLALSSPWDFPIPPEPSGLDNISVSDMSHQPHVSSIDFEWETRLLDRGVDARRYHSASPLSCHVPPRDQPVAGNRTPLTERLQVERSLFQDLFQTPQADLASGALVQFNQGRLTQIPREPSDLPTSLSEYFFREVITLYCAWDSKTNVMRNIVESAWQSSGALYHTIQSMSAACLSEDFPHLLPVARREHAQALHLIREGSLSSTHKPAMLLASQLLGHTSSWLNPHNLATDMFRTSYDILKDISAETGRDASVSFFSDTMDYWAMLLAYLTDSQQLGGYDQSSSIGPTNVTKFDEPHPYSGISRDTVRVLADIGILIFKYRKRMSAVKFLTETDIDVFRAALRDARRLERTLLAHHSPDLSQVKDPGDPKTPLKHLELIDEAYRCTGLLQLYRVFPDLLNERYASWDKDRLLCPLPSDKTPTAQERQTWLTKLAMHTLGILREIPFESRTRSAQPFIMVACSSELRRDPCHLQSPGAESGCLDVLAIDPASIEVVRARKFVLSRLAAYTHILPLQKSRVISELINQVWTALDGGDPDVYWLDVAHAKNLGTMMG